MRADTRPFSGLDWYYQQLNRYPVLSREEERVLAQRMRDHGDPEARQRLIQSNLRFVIRVANQYYTGYVPLPDLVNAGTIGLIRGLEKFDYRRGTKLITYAVYWIRVGINDLLAKQMRQVNMPMHFYSYLSVVMRAVERLYNRDGRMPSVAELMQETGLTEFYVRRALEVVEGDELLNVYHYGSDEQIIETYADPATPVPDLFEQTLTIQTINRSLTTLNDRERYICVHYFGLLGIEPRKLEDIAHDLHLSRERVRQIKGDILRKLRAKKELKALVA